MLIQKAKNGTIEDQYRLARFYENTDGIHHGHKKARDILISIGKHGDLKAQYTLYTQYLHTLSLVGVYQIDAKGA